MDKREWMLQAGIAIIGAGGSYLTRDAITEELSATYDAIVAATPEPTDEGWIEHRGEKPYPEGAVDVELRGGSQCHGENSDEWVWTHDPDAPEGDIVKWRPA